MPRFRRWVSTEPPGLHHRRPYPISAALLPKVADVNALRRAIGRAGSGASRMLTGDENIIEADYYVLWKIKAVGAVLFHVRAAEGMVRMAAEIAVREVIGRNPIQAALSDHPQQIATDAQDERQRLRDAQGAGILVIQVPLRRVDPPAEVTDAFNDE